MTLERVSGAPTAGVERPPAGKCAEGPARPLMAERLLRQLVTPLCREFEFEE